MLGLLFSTSTILRAQVPPPTLTSISPNAVGTSTTEPGNSTVVLTGTNFASENTTVNIGPPNPGVTVTSVSVVSATQIVAVLTVAVGATLGSATLTVTTPGGTSGPVSFTIVLEPVPTLTSMSPSSGPPGATVNVTLTGTNFIAEPSVQIVGSGVGFPAGVITTMVGTTQIDTQFLIAASATPGTTVQVLELNAGVSSNALTFTVAAPAELGITTTTLPTPWVVNTAYPTTTLQATGGTTPYTFSVSSGTFPTGLTLTSAGVISGTPTTVGTFTFAITVTDSSTPKQTAQQAYTVNIVLPKLTITTTSLPTPWVVNIAYPTTTLQATGGTTPYTWSVSSGTLPTGLTLTSAGVISGTPTTVGTFTFAVTVTDSSTSKQAAQQAYTVNIVPPKLSITTTSLPTPWVVNIAYPTTMLQATGGTTPYTWSVSSGTLPTGLTLTSAGVISGTPTTVGTFTFAITVTDSSVPTPQTAQQAYSVTIVPRGPSITTTSLPTPWVVNIAYPTTTLQATGGTTPYAFSVSSGTLPTGLTLSSAGVISGTPTTVGTFTFTVTVTDSSVPTPQTAQQAYSVTIVPPKLSITTTSLPTPWVVNTAYPSTTLLATGGTSPYTWSVSSGTLPTGLTLSSAGEISGTPTTLGTFNFTITVTDSSVPTSQTAQQAYSVTIVPPKLSITTTSLPNGVVNTAYPSTTLQATGGTSPNTWSVSSGTLPTGLTLSSAGEISGTPTTLGTFNFTITVTDSSVPTPQTAQQAYSVTVIPPISLTGLAATTVPTQNSSVGVSLGAPATTQLDGTLTLTFTSNAAGTGPNYIDPGTQFLAGGTTMDFTIPAGSSTANLPQGGAIQQGTTAGTITVTLTRLVAGTTNVLPQPNPSGSVIVSRQAPVIESSSLEITSQTSTGFTVQFNAYSTPRDLSNVTFTFQAAAGAQLQGTSFSLTLDGTSWFSSTQGLDNGGTFSIAAPFTFSGDTSALGSVTVTLSNSVGASSPATKPF